MWKVFHKKWLNSHIEREHQPTETQPIVLEKPTMFVNTNRRKNTSIEKDTFTSHYQPKNVNNINNNNKTTVSAYENRCHVIIGASNVGKTYYMIQILEKINNKGPIHKINRSPNYYPNYKTS